LSIAVVWENVKYFHGFFCKLVTVQPTASLLWNPTHLKFADRKGLDFLAEFTHSHHERQLTFIQVLNPLVWT